MQELNLFELMLTYMEELMIIAKLKNDLTEKDRNEFIQIIINYSPYKKLQCFKVLKLKEKLKLIILLE